MSNKKEMTIDDLAVMVQNGFFEQEKNLQSAVTTLEKRLDRIEFNTSSHDRRIDILEDKVQQISVKIGLSK